MSAGIVIVGANLAGGRAAEQLRKHGYEGRITLIGEEPERPYDRPPLSKKALRGQLPEEKLYLRPLDYYEKQRIDLVLGQRATSLDPRGKSVTLKDGTTIPYEHAIVATGARVRKLTCPGADLPGVHYVRTIADMRGIREHMQPGRKVVVIGAGVIGAESAASCREEGLDVVLLESAKIPLVRAFGADVGQLYAGFHRARGVDLRTEIGVVELRGHGKVEEVIASNGERFACDFVIAGIGVDCEVDWLESSGIVLEQGGIRVDAQARTSLPDVYAAGDVTTFFHPGEQRYVRVEAVDNAQLQGEAAVKAILGQPVTYAPVPFFWSDQFELKMQSVGLLDGYDRVVYRGDLEKPAFVAFHFRGDELRAAVGVSRLKEIGAAKRILSARVAIPDPAAFADEGYDIAALAPRPSSAPPA